jgi:hypothetical protein
LRDTERATGTLDSCRWDRNATHALSESELETRLIGHLQDFLMELGRGFLRRMVQFAEIFPEREIVVSLMRQLTWTHFIALIPLKDPLQRGFYAEMCRVERWSVRELRSRIDSMLFERTALSKKPAKLIEQELGALREEDKLTPMGVTGRVCHDRTNSTATGRERMPRGTSVSRSWRRPFMEAQAPRPGEVAATRHPLPAGRGTVGPAGLVRVYETVRKGPAGLVGVRDRAKI